MCSGSAAVPRGAVITEVSGKPVATLADFEKVMRELKRWRARTVRFFTIDDPRTAQWRVDAHGSALVPGAFLQARRRAGHLALHAMARGRRRRAA